LQAICEEQNVVVKMHKLIYKLTDNVVDLVNQIAIEEGNKYLHESKGKGEIKNVFNIQLKNSKCFDYKWEFIVIETLPVAGLVVKDGFLAKSQKFKVLRDSKVSKLWNEYHIDN
jgi:hypothetical protein